MNKADANPIGIEISSLYSPFLALYVAIHVFLAAHKYDVQ